MKYAAELWPVLNEYKIHPLETLTKLKDVGYDGIEMFGAPALPTTDLKKIIDQSGLILSGFQLPWVQFQDTQLEKTIRYQAELGNKHVIIDALGGPWESGHKVSNNTVKVWKHHAKRINEINSTLQEYDMDLTYHTHDYDYGELIENTIPSLQILLENISQSVNIEIDTGNCIEGGKSPISYLNTLKGRTQFVHCKPYSKSLRYEVRLGSNKDENNWPGIIHAAYDSGTEWLVVEPESTSLGDIFEVMKDSLEQLEKYKQK